MTTHEEMHRLRNTAVVMLPGFKQAQAQMAVASHVLEYFARFPECEISPDTSPTPSSVPTRGCSRRSRN
jgi:hypothetical protein